MPTKHPRIAVTRDDELDRALKETKRLLDARSTRSSASHVRALALRGAEAIVDEDGPENPAMRRLVERYGVQPAKGNLADLGPPPGDFDPDDPTPATDALNWARGE